MPSEIDRVLDAAHSEAKRLNCQPAELGVLAVAAAKRWAGPASELAADGALKALEGRLRSGTRYGDEAAVMAFVAQHGQREADGQAGDPRSVLARLFELTEVSTVSDGKQSPLPVEKDGAAGIPDSQIEDSRLDVPAMIAALQLRVIGQDSAVENVVRRLAVTRAGLDLRPERPDGVFLFVGPSGVGKTEFALALAQELFGSDDALIRLDMSEYSDSSAATRLVGPPPGYVGHDNPSAWLTTRMAKTSAKVLLLDEVEKADPSVWNVFLQVFDAGRLTDCKGVVASFSSTIVIMTSNIGAQAFTKNAMGFAGHSSSSSDVP